MSRPYGYGGAHPYWTMHPVQAVREPYCYAPRCWPFPADSWRCWEGRPHEGNYPPWEEYYHGPNADYAPPGYRGFRSPAYLYPSVPPPQAFAHERRPFHPSDQFRHPDEYPMRFVPVPSDYDYGASPPQMQAVKQESARETPNGMHCCGCPNHVCRFKGNDCPPKQIDSKQPADRNADDRKTKQQLQEYPLPVVWFPSGHRQFPKDCGINKSSEDGGKQIVHKNLEDNKWRSIPFFWIPMGFKPGEEDGDDSAEVQNSDQEKKYSNDSLRRSESAEEMGKEMQKPRDIPVQEFGKAKPSNEGISRSASAEELGKYISKLREIPVNEKQSEEQKATKSSSPGAPRLPPVCLRVDPLPRKANGKNSSRSPSPPHTGSAARTPTESVEKCEENGQSDASSIPEEANIRKNEEQTNAQANKSLENRVCSSQKALTIMETEAATRIQSFYRGYQVRKLQPLRKLREISKIKGRVRELMDEMSNSEACVGISRDVKAKDRFNETLMGLLLQLDAIQGLHPVVRERRKSVATEIVALQEKLDRLSIDRSQQIPFAAETTELQHHSSEVPALNECAEHLQDERELVVDDDREFPGKQEAFSSSEIAGQESPATAHKQQEMVLSSTSEQTNQTVGDALAIFATAKGDDSTDAEHENEETIQAPVGLLESFSVGTECDSVEVNVAQRGTDSAEVKVKGEHENKRYDSAEVKVEAEHENKIDIQSFGGALDSDIVEKEGESAEADTKNEVENENTHAVQAVESMKAGDGNNSTEQEAEINSENGAEKSCFAVKANGEGKSSVPVFEEVKEIKNPSEKTEEAELATKASNSAEEKPIKCSASSAVGEEQPSGCFPFTSSLKAGEISNPRLNIAFQSEEISNDSDESLTSATEFEISAKSDKLLTPATESGYKGDEFVPKCDCEPLNRFAQDKGLDALNPSAEPYSVEAATPQGLNHSGVEPQRAPECRLKTVDNKEDWEAENKRLKETVEKLLEAAKCQMSTIDKLNQKINHLESKLRRSRKTSRKNNVMLRR